MSRRRQLVPLLLLLFGVLASRSANVDGSADNPSANGSADRSDSPVNPEIHSQASIVPPFQDRQQSSQLAARGLVAQTSPGLRPGSFRYHTEDGFFFHRQRAAGGRVFLRCVSARAFPPCPARASMNVDLSDFVNLQGHNHGPDEWYERVQQLRNSLLDACRARPNVRVDVIFHEVCRNVPRDVSSRVSLLSMRPSMVRMQSDHRPNIPHTFDEFHDVLEFNLELRQTLDREEDLYRGWTGVEGHRSLVFMSNRVIDGFGHIRHLFCDATFYARPNNPASAQLYTIVSIRDNHVIPILHALMESRSELAYRDLFAFFRQLAPNIDPDFIVTDFEVSQLQAMHAIFPLTRLSGCLWHYARAVCRNVRALGLHALVRDQDNARRIVRLSLAIPLVPAARVQEALNVVIMESRRLALDQEFHDFFEYIRRTWIVGVGSATLSVFGVRHRTNNAVECHHRNINSRLVRRPNIWRFLELLAQIEDSSWRDLGRVEQGLAPSRARRATSLLNDARIRSCSRQLIQREMDLLHFMSAAAWHLDPTMRDMLMEREVADRPPSPERGPAPAPVCENPHWNVNDNDMCDPDLQENDYGGDIQGASRYQELDDADFFEDLIERDENHPPARGRSRGRGRSRVRRGRGRQPAPRMPPAGMPQAGMPPRMPRSGMPPSQIRPARIPLSGMPPRMPPQIPPSPMSRPTQVPTTTLVPSRLPVMRNEDFSEDEFLLEEPNDIARRWRECIICNSRVGRYAILGCGAFPLCGFCLRQWFVRGGMRNCPHCGSPNAEWVRLNL